MTKNTNLAQALAIDSQLRLPGSAGRLLKQIRDIEKVAPLFRDAGLIVFTLASGNASAADTAELVVSLHGKFQKLARTVKRPAMFSVTLGKTISLVRR